MYIFYNFRHILNSEENECCNQTLTNYFISKKKFEEVVITTSSIYDEHEMTLIRCKELIRILMPTLNFADHLFYEQIMLIKVE